MKLETKLTTEESKHELLEYPKLFFKKYAKNM